MTSNVGGALRSRTLFCVRRRRASSSPRVTVWMPPIRSVSVGLSIRLSRLLPWAVPISWTPRSAIVRAAWASSSVPISSMTMTSGMWFSTASIITSCWSGRRPDLHPPGPADGRVRDVAVAGDLVARVHHDDALALVVGQHAGGLAQHRGLADARPAHDQDRLPGLDEVVDDLDRAVDRAADAAGQADDLAGPVADGADAVERPLDAGAVVVAEDADVVDDVLDVRLGDLAVEQRHLAVGEAGLGPAAEVHHDLDQLGRIGQRAGRPAGRRAAAPRRSRLRSSIDSRRPASRPDQSRVLLLCWLAYRRDERRLGHAHDGLLHQERHGVQAGETGLLEAAIDRRFVGSNGRQDAVVRAAAAAADARRRAARGRSSTSSVTSVSGRARTLR